MSISYYLSNYDRKIERDEHPKLLTTPFLNLVFEKKLSTGMAGFDALYFTYVIKLISREGNGTKQTHP